MFEFVKDYWTVVWEFLLDSNRAAAMGILLVVLGMFLAALQKNHRSRDKAAIHQYDNRPDGV